MQHFYVTELTRKYNKTVDMTCTYNWGLIAQKLVIERLQNKKWTPKDNDCRSLVCWQAYNVSLIITK